MVTSQPLASMLPVSTNSWIEIERQNQVLSGFHGYRTFMVMTVRLTNIYKKHSDKTTAE